jgi:hypothetical protein
MTHLLGHLARVFGVHTANNLDICADLQNKQLTGFCNPVSVSSSILGEGIFLFLTQA